MALRRQDAGKRAEINRLTVAGRKSGARRGFGYRPRKRTSWPAGSEKSD
jgi:hypothetical protein